MMYKVIGGDQKEYGPVSAEQLRQWIAQGRVDGRTHVLAEGATQWKLISELPEFSVPPVSGQIPQASAPAGGTNGLAITAFVLSLTTLLCACVPFGLLSLILAWIARSQLKSRPGQEGKGLTTAAIIISIVGILIWIGIGILAACGVFADMLPEGMDKYNM